MRQLIRFGLVGASTYLLSVWVFEFTHGPLGWHRRLAASIAFVTGAASHFLLSKYFTFANRDHRLHHQAIRYVILCLANYLITMLIFECIVRWTARSTTLAFALSVPATTALTYLTLRYWVFRHGAS